MASTRRGVARGSRAAADDAKDAPKRFDERRTCAICGTALSAYNSGPYCWRHSDAMPWRGPAGAPKNA